MAGSRCIKTINMTNILFLRRRCRVALSRMTGKRSLWIILWLAAASFISACCKKKVYCTAENLKIAIAGHVRFDVRTITVKKYKIGEFNKALDSTIFTYTGTKPVIIGKRDTLYFTEYTSTSATLLGITQGFDWNVYIPSLRENYRISKLTDQGHLSEKVKCGDNDATCTNPLAHFVVNEVWTDGNQLWISKKP